MALLSVRVRARQDVSIGDLVGLCIHGNGMSVRSVRIRTRNRLDDAAFPAPLVEAFKRILGL